MENLEGYLCMVLHTHLPFVNHPENDNYIEEQWLYEAITETYIPLITILKKLVDENVKFKITMSLTPPLLEMLNSRIQQEKYIRYLEKHIELCSKEIERTKYINEKENELARFYYNTYQDCLYKFNTEYNRNIIEQFKYLQDKGVIEIITCCATHGFIPMLCTNENNIEVQIKYGVQTYEKYFCKKPNGIWLAECGYVEDVERTLKKYDIKYFFTEMHGLLYARPIPIYGTYAPIITPSGIAVFGRNVESTMEIWSQSTGYPGDSNYREFSRDIGYDLDYEYIKPYITYDGIRIPTGIKYYSVSGKEDDKWYYNPEQAKRTAETHAYDYMQKTIAEVQNVKENMDGNFPIIVSMQDAELYGHWWYEGPYWLYILIKKLYYDQDKIDFITPSEYIEKYPKMQISKPAMSSWGSGGTNTQWLACNPQDIYIHLEILSTRMTNLAKDYKNETNELKIRALNQCARELILLQSSDWYFNLTCHRVEEYSYKRIKEHIENFNTIYEQIKNDSINVSMLERIEMQNCIFSQVDYKDYAIY